MSDDLLMDGIAQEAGAYHINCNANDIANNIIIVGDPDRVEKFKPFFDRISHESQNREFRILTGTINQIEISVISSGMGTDNIDILIQEIHFIKCLKNKKKLKFLRIGTTGAIRNDIEVGSIIQSKYAIGLDGMLNYYQPVYSNEEKLFLNEFVKKALWPEKLAFPYLGKSGYSFSNQNFTDGITLTTNSFYGAQARELNLKSILSKDLFSRIENLDFKGFHISNFEMEMAGIYGLCNLLGHEANGLCLVLVNRYKASTLNHHELKMNEFIKTAVNQFVMHLKKHN